MIWSHVGHESFLNQYKSQDLLNDQSSREKELKIEDERAHPWGGSFRERGCRKQTHRSITMKRQSYGLDWTPGQAGGRTKNHGEVGDLVRHQEQSVHWPPFTETLVALSTDQFLFACTYTLVLFIKKKIKPLLVNCRHPLTTHCLQNAILRLHCNVKHLLNL